MAKFSKNHIFFCKKVYLLIKIKEQKDDVFLQLMKKGKLIFYVGVAITIFKGWSEIWGSLVAHWISCTTHTLIVVCLNVNSNFFPTSVLNSLEVKYGCGSLWHTNHFYAEKWPILGHQYDSWRRINKVV